ncbi:MAG: glycosyltransferase family 4 protein [Micromonosporaceae bacterium]|nr:glycosyltransferase family 4 protein [Micromonosporaceae bacterium]
MSRNRTVHIVLPNNIDDHEHPSGGNLYDRHLLRGLTAAGWSVQEHPIRGSWPAAVPAAHAALARMLATLPDNALVMLDGLVASGVPEVLVPEAKRLRLVVLMHMPLAGAAAGDPGERDVLRAAAAVVTTSAWTRQRLLELYQLPGKPVHVATPGVDPAPPGTGSAGGDRLLCVAAVTRQKGYAVLAEALAQVADAPWSCLCVGSREREPEFVAELEEKLDGYGLAERVQLLGVRTGEKLAARYAEADLLVLASFGETYGMVVTEALARGVPVLATEVGGVPEALGRAPDGGLPGLLVPPGEPDALARALRAWLADPALRDQLRARASARRGTLTDWSATAEAVSKALAATAG